MKCGRYEVTIKTKYGRWLVGHNRTVGWCVVDRDNAEILTVHQDRKLADKRANALLIKDQDRARQSSPEPDLYLVETRDPRSYEWHVVLSNAQRDRAIEVAVLLTTDTVDARISSMRG